MTEEMTNASKEAPKAIVWSVYLGGITGFVFLVTAYFCMGDIDSVASSSTGVPLIQIFYNATGSVAGANVLTTLITVIVMVAANALLAEGSRALYAFARDHGLPFSSLWAKVHPRLQVPIYAILLACVVQGALNSIYFGTFTGFSTVISIAAEGFYLSYAMPLLARILPRMTGHAKVLNGPYTLGKYGFYMNVAGFIFLLFAAITFNFPTLSPVDSENMNYCSAAIGIIALVSATTWIVDGRKNFTGPDTGAENLVAQEKRESIAAAGSGSESPGLVGGKVGEKASV
jgi:choline transport protein